MKFLDYIGFKPVVNRCSSCGEKKSNEYMFNAYEGGILCKACSGIFEENMKIDITTVKLMEYILSNDILRCSKAKVSKYITYELQRILKQYFLLLFYYSPLSTPLLFSSSCNKCSDLKLIL